MNKREFYDALAGWDLRSIQLFEQFLCEFAMNNGIEYLPDINSFSKCMSIQGFSNILDQDRTGWQDWECGYYGAICVAWLMAQKVDVDHIELEENQKIILGHWLEYFQLIQPSDLKSLAQLKQKDHYLTRVIWG